MRRGRGATMWTVVGITAVACACLIAAAPAGAASEDFRIAASDGVTLQATLTGERLERPRPTIVEFSPYGRDSATATAPPGVNFLLVQIRGTGDSDGRFDALGPRTQRDVRDVLAWACRQPWSDGNLALNGMSASAITVYNSLHLKLPCVRAAVLRSGTFELYRDLLYPGGVSNLIPGAAVLAAIGATASIQGGERLARNPASSAEIAAGLIGVGLSDMLHPTQDRWWQRRGFRGDANDLPILMIDGFFDVESRGAFEAFRELRSDGARLLVSGGHDAAPAGTNGGRRETREWFAHFLLGADNGVTERRRVRLLLADGDREDYVNGRLLRRGGSRWPLPGTHWEPLYLNPGRAGAANSINDGSLGIRPSARSAEQAYPALPSVPTATDPPNAAIVGAGGLDQLSAPFPLLTDMTVAEPLGLSYTGPRLRRSLIAAGPATLELELATSAPETAIWVVLSDVSPDGTPHPLTAGRLLSSYPKVDRSRSLRRDGEIVQPYGDFSRKRPASPGEFRRYSVELWPVGNRFRKGHRIRVDIVGASAASLPAVPALNRVRAGGSRAGRLLLPLLRSSDLGAAFP